MDGTLYKFDPLTSLGMLSLLRMLMRRLPLIPSPRMCHGAIQGSSRRSPTFRSSSGVSLRWTRRTWCLLLFLGAVAVHLGCGCWGIIAAGLFASQAGCRGFESHLPPKNKSLSNIERLFLCIQNSLLMISIQ